MTTEQEGFSEEERAAMKERASELKKVGRRGSGAKNAEADAADCREKIQAMPVDERAIAEALHAAVAEHAPQLAARTWYGMPAYALDGKVIVFFKGASKFKTRYSEVGFNEEARLDDGDMWPTAYGVTALTPTVRDSLVDLVTRAVRRD